MSLMKSIEGETFGIIDICSYAVYPQHSYFTQLHPESINPTVLDLRQYALNLRSSQNFLPLGYDTLPTPTTYENVMSQTNMDLIALINQNTYWFWGSCEKGGVGLALARNGRITVIKSYGLCYNASTDQYMWGIYETAFSNSYTPTMINRVFESCFFGYQYGFVEGTRELKPSYELLTVNPDRGNTFFLIGKQWQPDPYYIHWIKPDLLHPNYRAENMGAFGSYSEVFTKSNEGYGIGTYDDGGVLINFETVYYPTYEYLQPTYTKAEAILIDELPPVGWQSQNGATIFGGGEIPKQPNTSGGTSGGGGGGGGFDNTTDNDDFTDPTNWTDALDTGFISLYSPTKAQLKDLANFLYSGITASAEITLKKLLANPMDYLVCLNMCHFNPPVVETDTVKFASISTGVVMNRIGKQFVKMYGGHFDVNEQFMTFLDYGKYSSVKISIPYCGIYPLDINAIMGGRLELSYIIDLLTGSLTAELKITRQRSYVSENNTSKVFATYSGNCFLPIPIASTDYRNAVNSLLGMTSGLATSIATGNPLPLIGSAAHAVVNSKQDVNMGSNIGNNYGYMTQQEAFLILERPCQNLPLNYPYYEGYPSNIRVKQLGVVKQKALENGESGVYVEIANDNYWVGSVKNPFGKITSTEAEELATIMKGGVWL